MARRRRLPGLPHTDLRAGSGSLLPLGVRGDGGPAPEGAHRAGAGLGDAHPASGGEIKVASFQPNDLVGEIAILCDVARTATVRATTPLLTLRIKKDHFLRLISEFPEMAVEIMRVLADRLSRTTAELTDARGQLSRRIH